VPGLLHELPGERDRVLDVGHPGDRPGVERRAVHDRRIELVLRIGGEHCALARVEQRGVLQHDDRGLDGLDAGSSPAQCLEAGAHCLGEGFAELPLHLRCEVFAPDGSRTTVNREHHVLHELATVRVLLLYELAAMRVLLLCGNHQRLRHRVRCRTLW
jgi:hypothetical protein